MKTYEKNGDQYIIKFSGADFKKALTSMHSLDKGRYDSQNRYWICKITDWNTNVLVNAGFKNATQTITTTPVFIPPKINNDPVNESLLPKGMYPYQIEGVKAIHANYGKYMLLDEMGVGKTPQAIAYCKCHPELKHILIVCPAFIKINWQREIKRWADEKSTVLSGTEPYSLDTVNRFVIINYNILSSWLPELMKTRWDIIIADEAQYVANNTAQRTKAFIRIAEATPRRLFLSGTLMRNRPSELFTALNLVSPLNFPNRWKFLWRYCDPKHSGYGWEFKGATNIEELSERIKPFYIRRLKSEVLKDLPPKQRNVITFSMADKQQHEYENASEKFREWAENANRKALDGRTCVEYLRQIAYAGKRNDILEWISDFLETGKKLIVFAYHKQAIEDLKDMLKDNCVVVDGSTSMEDRQAYVDRFQTDPTLQVFVGQIQAAGVGITLTAASDVVFVEFPWSPADVAQAEDRSNRIGQLADKVSIWYLVAENTIDEDMVGAIQEKNKVIENIMGGQADDLYFGEDIVSILLHKGKA